MFVQITIFDGPRGRDLVEASERAGRDRIAPLVEANPRLRDGLIGGLRALAPDGAARYEVAGLVGRLGQLLESEREPSR